MKVLVLGSGGREHALIWKLSQSPRVTQLYCAPGNAGTAKLASNVPIPIANQSELLAFALKEAIDLTVVGPDDALAAGVVDLFKKNGLRIFGPTQFAAQFESSKIFAKEFMVRHGIPTAASGHFSDPAAARSFCKSMKYPVVIKADGLALGKGVVIAMTPTEADETIHQMMEKRQFGAAGSNVVVEEFLVGQECSIHALVGGGEYLLFPGAQDHKQVFDGDQGPNTGGMGTFSPPPLFDAKLQEEVRSKVLEPFIGGLQSEGIEYSGLLFPGLMVTADGLRVLEFNSRFGDPETQVLMRRLKSDLLDLLEATIDGRLSECQPEWDERIAVCVIMASGGYPGSYASGKPIRGLEQFEKDSEITVFHAGTKIENGQLATAGGRVLGVTALGEDLQSARTKAYAAVAKIDFDGAHYRKDIGLKGLLVG